VKTMSNANSDRQASLLATAGKVFPGGVLGRHRLPDDRAIVFARGQGAHLFDAAGREYIDFTCGGGTLLLGYDNKEVTEAIRGQLEKGTHFLTIVNDVAIEYAADLLEVIPCGERVRLACTGSEATFHALRLARAYTCRDKILKFEGAFHGSHDYAMWSYNTGVTGNYPKPLANTAGMPASIADEVLVAPFNNYHATEHIIRQYQDELAAVIVEPVQRMCGPVPGFLESLRAITEELGIVLIFDEAVTGFRLALGGAQERYGVLPDLAVYGKAVGAGLPLSAVAGREDIMQLCDPRAWGENPRAVYLSGTLYGNPVTVAAAHAFLKVVRKSGVYPPFFEKVDSLKQGLREIIERRGIAARVFGEGPLWHLVFTDASPTGTDKERLLMFHYGLIDEGIFVRPGGGHFFSMAHTDADVTLTLEAVDRVLARMGNKRGGEV